MNEVVLKILQNPRYAKALEWGKLLTITGGAQVLIQALGLVSGIMVIRLLPTEEYALYTLANTMLGTMTILADGGVSTGVLAEGGKVWQDREKLGSVLTTGLYLRKKFAIGSLLIAIPILLYLLRNNGASWLMAILLVASLIPAFLSSLSGTLLQIPLKLRQDIKPLQKNQIAINIGRFGILLLTIFIFPWAAMAILASAIPQLYGNNNLMKISKKYIIETNKIEKEVKDRIIKIVKSMFPSILYYCISSQIIIWIVSILGSTEVIAQIGAIGRLTIILSVIGTAINTVIVPKFSKETRKIILIKQYSLTLIGTAILCIFMFIIIYIFSKEILWILGNQYKNLNKELFLYTISSCIMLISSCSLNLYLSKGWIISPAPLIILSLFSTIFIGLLSDLDSLVGLLFFNISISITQAVIHTSFGFFKVLTLKNEIKKDLLYR
jgi:O-antigen/teichoic acid export membrane protein